jgi:hypothetical protein
VGHVRVRKPRQSRFPPATVAGIVGTVALVTAMAWWRPWQPPPGGTGAGRTAQVTTSTASAPSGPDGNPAWLTGRPAPGIAIVAPVDGQRTTACVAVRGTAEGLAADQTIIVAARKRAADPQDVFFLHRIADSADPVPVRSWSAPTIYLGAGADEEYDIYALTADRQSVRDVWTAPDGPVTSRAPIAGLRRGDHVVIHQKGACPIAGQ